MVNYRYGKNDFPTFKDGIIREWVVTNGIGGYAGSSLIGAHNRTHQGYLIASLHSPTDRYLVLSKINEAIGSVSLETSQHLKDGKTVYHEGQKFLEEYNYDGTVSYTYHVLDDTQGIDVILKKYFCLERGKNRCAIAYEIQNHGVATTLELTPLFNFREHSDSSKPETLHFATEKRGCNYTLIPGKHPDLQIHFQVSEGCFVERAEQYDMHMQLQIEVDLETDGLDCHYCPTTVSIEIPENSSKKVSVLCDIEEKVDLSKTISSEAAFDIVAAQKTYVKNLIEHAGYNDEFANRLVLASDQFLTHRHSTGLKTVLAGLPWFTDWGRDTMIAFTGLTLCTKRFKDAEEILLTFAKYVKNGIVPNMFPDDNTPPLYNTVDASLWYFYAVYEYLQFHPTDEAYNFIFENIYPKLIEIIDAYKNGTDFSIYMEEDGLIHAGSGLDQITWMDVRVGDWVATPRHGKPVEINALWYNALKVMEFLTMKKTGDASVYTNLASQVKESFCQKFWNEKTGALYDVVDGDEEDDHLRPNQIFAVSLPFTMLSAEQEASIVAIVEKELFVGCGLRSLSSDHADYHGIYCGALEKRDRAYHQGTAWGFLLGGFFTAYMKVNHHSKESALRAYEMLEPIRKHLEDNGCIGSISEIFDGDEPHNPRGCYAQAWSVGEVLRCYIQDIYPYL